MERYSITDLITLALRRVFWVFIPFATLMIIGLLVLDTIPARFHSKAVLILEDQQISPDLVPSAIRALAEDRLATIQAQLRAREAVVELSEKFNLIDRNSDEPFSKKVSAVRDDITISIRRVDGGAGGRRNAGAIAFEIGFVHESPDVAYRVANNLVTEFIDANVSSRLEAAEGTAAFLRSEEQDLRRQIATVQNQIADVRNSNPGVSPDDLSLNRDIVDRLSADITRAEERLQATEQELSLLRLQKPLLIEGSGTEDLELQELRVKRSELAALKRQYTDTYPDVVALTDEVLELEARLDPESFLRRAGPVTAATQTELADPENGLNAREIGALEQRLAMIADLTATANNPTSGKSLARVSYEANEQVLLQRSAAIEGRLDILREQLTGAEERLERTPAIAAEVQSLDAEEERLQLLLSRTQEKRAIAERSESLESQQKAERVVVLEAPIRPDVPTSPDKPKLMMALVGFAGGLAAVLGLGPIFLFPKVETERQLSHAIPHAPTIDIPEVADDDTLAFRRNIFIILAGISAILGAVALLVAVKVIL
ncbi:MAG: hypothetical protein AAFX52_10060 [Pseudomonadota bacterium]